MYRGLTPNLLGNASSWALYFYFYDALKTMIQSSFHTNGSNLQASDYLAASATAGELPVHSLETLLIRYGRHSNYGNNKSSMGCEDPHAVHIFEP